jgi:uncharacterized membrane-anchored protein YitT (DUF2179 family)
LKLPNMKSHTSKQLLLLLGFGILVYGVDTFLVPHYGMGLSSGVSAILILILLVLSRFVTMGEKDEREHMLQLESDSAALYVVIAGLLAAAIFFPESEFAMVFWAVLGRVIAFLYQRNK